MMSAREIALGVLTDVETRGAYANLALRSRLERENPARRDRAFATELVYGSLRSLLTIDWVLGRFLKKPLNKQPEAVRNILRLGVYQLLFMDRVPDSAVCNESANLARRYGHPGAVKFVNGVLRNIARNKDILVFPDPVADPVGYISLKYSHPEWIVRKWLKAFGFQETESLCRANNESAPTTVRANTLKISRQELANLLVQEGFSVSMTPLAPEGLSVRGIFAPGKLSAYTGGLMAVQDESSMLVAHALAPKAGTRVLDVASAPGGKTTHLAQLMKNKGEILACDLYEHKLKLVKDNCRRLGVDIVRTYRGDARQLSGELQNWAEYILVDAPCSGLGVLWRRPDIRWRMKEEQIKDIISVQRDILEEAGRCLAPGGVMVYSTCTVSPEENACLVEGFLAANGNFTLQSLEDLLPSSLEGLERGFIQLLPHKHHTDGFFMARMQKKRE